jgi:hypothetical protein
MNGNNYLRNNYNPKKGLGAPRKKTGGKPYKFAHTSGSQKGLGDYYGTGVRAKLGIMRDGMGMQEITPAKMKRAPRSLA